MPPYGQLIYSGLNKSNQSSPQPDLNMSTQTALKMALEVMPYVDDSSTHYEMVTDLETRVSQSSEWHLSVVDENCSEPPTLREEVARLETLRSFSLQGEKCEESFDRITDMARRLFNASTALISIVDLEQVFIFSQAGFERFQHYPRKDSLCSYAIYSKSSVMVIPDTSKDKRFISYSATKDSVRFYAGAPLVSREGYKLGNLCILDTNARPEGMTDLEKCTLVDLSKMIIDLLESRRSRSLDESSEGMSTVVTKSSARDLIIPLEGLRIAISSLQNDPNLLLKMNTEQKELLSAARSASDMVSEIFREITSMKGTKNLSENNQRCKLTNLVYNLHKIMEQIPKTAPLIISVEENTPDIIQCDEIKVFRASLNLIAVACRRTMKGSVRVRIGYLRESSELRFTCEDTAPHIPEADVEKLFANAEPCELFDEVLEGVHYACKLMKSIGGSVGYRKVAYQDQNAHRPQRGGKADAKPHGSVFWYKLPAEPRSDDEDYQTTEQMAPLLLSSDPSDIATRRFSVGESTLGSGEFSLSSAKGPQVGKVTPIISNLKCIDDRMRFILEQRQQRCMDDKMQRKKRALVIDDSLVIRKNLARLLAKLGYSVTSAQDGIQGLSALKEDLFDICFCDYLMPVLDGLDCVEKYREWELEHRPWFHQRIVGMSAFAREKDTERGQIAGMDHFLAKPVNPRILEATLRSEPALQLSRYLDELIGPSVDELKVQGDDICSHGTVVPDDSDQRWKDGNDTPVVKMPKRSSSHPRLLDLEGPSIDAGSTASASLNCTFGSSRSVDDNVDCDKIPVCLIASDKDSAIMTIRVFEEHNWQCELVDNSNDTFDMLKMHSWDAVIVDEDLVCEDGMSCIARFREWEDKHRGTKQKNIFLECSVPDYFGSSPRTPSSEMSTVVHAPAGFDGALTSPVRWCDFFSLYEMGSFFDSAPHAPNQVPRQRLNTIQNATLGPVLPVRTSSGISRRT